jgi:hypothetical protein
MPIAVKQQKLPSLFRQSGQVALLAAVERELRVVVEPTLLDGNARHSVDMIRRILLDIVARQVDELEVYAMVAEAEREALRQLASLAGKRGSQGLALADRLSIYLMDTESSGIMPEPSTGLAEVLTSAFDELAELDPQGESAEFSEGLAAILGNLFDTSCAAEQRYQSTASRMESEIRSTASEGGVITQEGLERFLREHMLEVANLKVTRLSRPPTGWGKVTIIADLAGERLPYTSVVVRQDAAVSGTGTFVSDEYPIIKFVHAQGLPVPEPLFVNSETGVLGRPFIVMSRLPGSVGGGFGGSEFRMYTRGIAGSGWYRRQASRA